MDGAHTKTTTREEKWLPARLIPTSGIKGVKEQEGRATSALLSVLTAVPEFSRALLKKTGAPAGKLSAYIETPFDTKDGAKVRPDGAIIIRRGNQEWRAFVEVKTGNQTLDRGQVEAYLDLARDEGFDAVITISNQMNTAVDDHPVQVAKSKVKRVALHHYSWVAVATTALIQHDFRGVSDPDQAWILSELIAYLEHPQSGAMEFTDMGPHWVQVRKGARDGSLRPSDEGVADVITRWEQFLQYLSLSLSRRLGVKVKQVLSRRETDPAVRRATLTAQLLESGDLSGTLRVQNAAGDITLVASLKARTVTVSVDVAAPKEGQPQTRINWLIRQLQDAPGDARVEAWYKMERYPVTELLSDVRENSHSLRASDRTKAARSFVVSQTGEMGTKRSGTKGSFTSQASSLVQEFYRDVVEGLTPWTPRVPKLRKAKDEESSETAETAQQS